MAWVVLRRYRREERGGRNIEGEREALQSPKAWSGGAALDRAERHLGAVDPLREGRLRQPSLPAQRTDVVTGLFRKRHRTIR